MPNLACSKFATLDDVLSATCACTLNEEDHGDLIEEYLDEASDFLFVLSGGRVTGRCYRTVWPIKVCVGGVGDVAGHSDRADWIRWDSIDSIPLAGPATMIEEITIDGLALDPSEYGLLDGNKLFRRTGEWPTSNDITLDDSQVGTFTVSFWFGRAVEAITRRACVELVCQMVKGDMAGLNRLRGIVSANVQGVSVQLDDDEVTSLGLPEVNRFMDRYAPRGLGMLGVWTPELDHGWRLVTVTGGSGS